jgi:serine/threonine protein kinase
MELIGSRFGHIRIVDLLGQGGMGDVYAGYDETLQRRVALKAIRPEQRLDAEARSRLIREARTLSQLEHPNICRIYDYIEGEEVDLLVLELIEGKTLEEALRDGLSLTEKVRIVDAIARVLVAAHRAGIIHRDLKPENVMLTPAGEVKVLDFGLARWAEKSTHASSGGESSVKPTESIRSQLLHVSEKIQEEWFPLDDTNSTLVVPTVMVLPTPEKKRDRGLLTAAGVTMGTPLYMSPEQARGETLTPASDMYSFGLVMQTLFTGREPYEATMSGREVMLAASRGESLPVIGTTRDITALIERLKQLAPTDRPTAVEALDRLRWIAERPKRLVRELTAAVVILIVVLSAWKYVTDLRRERAAAVAAETEATARRAQAEDLIGFMLGDLRKKLEPVGRLDILDDVATKSLEYTSSLDTNRVTAAELTRSSKALNQLGDVRIAQGNVAAASAVFAESLRLANIAARKDPRDAEAVLAAGTAHFWIGNALRLQGKLDEALQHMIAYRTAAEQAAALKPLDDRFRVERAYSHSTVGTILDTKGALGEALREYEITLEIQRARVAAAPDITSRRADVARTLNKVGFVQQRLGNLAAARQQFEAEFAIYNDLIRLDERNAYYRERLANSHSYLSTLSEMVGDDAAALQHRLQESALETSLRERDGANANWQRNLAITRMRIASLLRVRGDLAGANDAVDEAERLMTAVAAKDVNRVAWRRDLAVIAANRAKVLLARGRVSDALLTAERAASNLAATRNADGGSARLYAAARLIYGEVLAAAGQKQRAFAEWRGASEVIASQVATSADPELLEVYARSLIYQCRMGEAQPFIARLHATGYHAREFESIATGGGCGSSSGK